MALLRLRITFNASLSASEKGQQWKMALQLLDEIHLAGKVRIRWVGCNPWELVVYVIGKLVGGLELVLFFHILGIIIPTD